MRSFTVWGRVTAALTFLVAHSGCSIMDTATEQPSIAQVHYLEIVCNDVATMCSNLEQVHGLSFGEPVAEYGQARLADAPDGSQIGVRAPMAEHEQPIVRTYLRVDDIQKAVQEAESGGATIAYPPTQQGDTGTWAIYILGDIQMGLWQR